MPRIYAKLKSQQGVTILYGLLFMLVALMVTAVMLSASVTVAMRVHSEEERTQDMLTLQSAAEALRACLVNTSFTTTITLDSDGETVVDAAIVSSSGPLADFLSSSFEDAMAQMKAHFLTDIEVEGIPLEVDTDGVAEVLENAQVELSYTMPTSSHISGDDTSYNEEMYSLRMTIALPDSDRQVFLWAKSTTETVATSDTSRTETISWTLDNIAINTRKDKLWEQTS